MRRLLFVIVPLLLMHLLCQRLGAQSIDPTLAAMIVLYTEKAENSLRTEQEAGSGNWTKSSTSTWTLSTESSSMRPRSTDSTMR